MGHFHTRRWILRPRLRPVAIGVAEARYALEALDSFLRTTLFGHTKFLFINEVTKKAGNGIFVWLCWLMKDLRNSANGAVFEVLSKCGCGVKRNSRGLPSWSREARKLRVFPETFWRLQAPATAREISSWYQLTATRMQHLKSLSPREIVVVGIVILWITSILMTRCNDTRRFLP